MGLWISPRVMMFIGLVSCTVYDEAALERRTSSTSAQRFELDAASAAPAMERVQTAVGCTGERCVTVSDGGVLQPGSRDAATRERAAAGDAAPRETAPDERADTASPEEDAAAPPSDAEAPAAEPESGFCSACDSRPAAPPVLDASGGKGNVTTYGSVASPAPSAGGACNYGASDILYYAAINVHAQAGDGNGQWQGGRICGQCAAVRVKTPEGWKETVVRIVDKCADPNCGIVVSGAAARDLMGTLPGRYDGDWRFVPCSDHAGVSGGPAVLHVKEGSSTWWALVHVRNPVQAVIEIAWQSLDGASAGTFSYATEAENFYSVPEAIHAYGMIRLTIRYRDGSQTELSLAPSQLAQPNTEIVLP
jgi:hypothetical protein